MEGIALYYDLVEYFLKEQTEEEHKFLKHRIIARLELLEEERRRVPGSEPYFDFIEPTK